MFLEPLHTSWPQTLPRVSEHIIVLEGGNSQLKMYTSTGRCSFEWKNKYTSFERNFEQERERIGRTIAPKVVWSSVSSELTNKLKRTLNSTESVEIAELLPRVVSSLKAEHITGIGNDRLLNALGARHIVQQLVANPNTSILSIDAGTATTLQLLNHHGSLLGGSISMGVSSQFQALNSIAPALPLLSTETIGNALPNLFEPATNTIQAMVNGTLAPLVSHIRAEVNRLRTVNSNVVVVISGGNMNVLVQSLYQTSGNGDVPIVASQDTNAVGLYQVYQQLIPN